MEKLVQSIPSQQMQPVQASRMFTVITEQLLEYVERHHLKNGDRLPNEGEIARMLNVSRPTLRQALRILENSGVLSIRSGQNGGVFVKSDLIPINIVTDTVAQEVDSIEALLRTRRLTEPIVVHLAAENATAKEFEAIEYANELMGKHRNSHEMVTRADGMYHRRVALAAHDEILRAAMFSLYRKLFPLRLEWVRRSPSIDHAIEIHRRQLDAMRRRDHDLIDQVMDQTFRELELDGSLNMNFEIRWIKRPTTAN